MPTTGKFPQHHLPAGSQVLCKDITKDKPGAELISGFLASLRRLFPHGTKSFAKVSRGGKKS